MCVWWYCCSNPLSQCTCSRPRRAYLSLCASSLVSAAMPRIMLQSAEHIHARMRPGLQVHVKAWRGVVVGTCGRRVCGAPKCACMPRHTSCCLIMQRKAECGTTAVQTRPCRIHVFKRRPHRSSRQCTSTCTYLQHHARAHVHAHHPRRACARGNFS